MNSTSILPATAQPTSGVGQSSPYVALGAIRIGETETAGQILDLSSCLCISGPKAGEAYPQSSIDLLVHYGSITTYIVKHKRHARHHSVRVLVRPEDAQRPRIGDWTVQGRKLLKEIMAYIDRSQSAWAADWEADSSFEPYLGRPDQESLFYIFNTLPSPRPSIESIADTRSRRAAEDILEYSLAGLQTPLYPYQQRSAAMMIQRETCPKKSLDPRQAGFHGPEGGQFYYDNESGILLLCPPLYEQPRGGILAETMGYGKTLICITVILATRGHSSCIPIDKKECPEKVPQTVASLAEMAAAGTIHNSIPWKAEFHDLAKRGDHYENCVRLLQSRRKAYTEGLLSHRTPGRIGKRASGKVVRLSSATLVIVPPNLLVQWRQEIEKHTEKGSLDVLVLDLSCRRIPNCDRLARYDIVLMSKNRFDREYRKDTLDTERQSYQSPLTDLRWLRVILDEGVGFSGTTMHTNVMAMLGKIYSDRRWVVSGTPSNSLHGVEVSLAASETVYGKAGGHSDIQFTILHNRRTSDVMDRENRDLEKLKIITTKFLKVQPWANVPGNDHAKWSRYLVPFDSRGRPRDVKGLRALLEGITVRHTIQDIELELLLPPLHNKVVYLEPSFHDRLSINLFVMFLVSNTVTSERTEEDYMFHPKNRKRLDELVNNLCDSSFHWTGIKKHEVEECVRNNKTYLEDKAQTILATDRTLLTAAIEVGERAISHAGWLAFSTLHEIGVYVKEFPEHAADAWALYRASSLLLLGTVQARDAQRYVREHASDADPGEGLPGAGIRSLHVARRRGVDDDNRPAKRRAATIQHGREPAKRNRSTRADRPGQRAEQQQEHERDHSPTRLLPPDSVFHKSRILGFSSGKLSYLVDQLLLHHSTSKIIIFYDHENIAFFIAEALELLSLPFRIYARSLPPAKRSAYLSRFTGDDETTSSLPSEPQIRILLMSLHHASHGLHIAAANRIYIVTPIWQPHIEAQAIKRAHRIGQTKPVYVETLVLKGTLEDQMLKRRREMSHAELREAERSLLDDGGMRRVVERMQFLPFPDLGKGIAAEVARLSVPIKLFDLSQGLDPTPSPRQKKKKRRRSGEEEEENYEQAWGG